jgi:hypothetical protein
MVSRFIGQPVLDLKRRRVRTEAGLRLGQQGLDWRSEALRPGRD